MIRLLIISLLFKKTNYIVTSLGLHQIENIQVRCMSETVQGVQYSSGTIPTLPSRLSNLVKMSDMSRWSNPGSPEMHVSVSPLHNPGEVFKWTKRLYIEVTQPNKYLLRYLLTSQGKLYEIGPIRSTGVATAAWHDVIRSRHHVSSKSSCLSSKRIYGNSSFFD